MLDSTAMREVNELSAEYMLRHKDVPFDQVVEDVAFVFPAGGYGGVTGGPQGYVRGEPVVLIVVVPAILGTPYLFAPFLGALLVPNDERYGGDNLNRAVRLMRERESA